MYGGGGEKNLLDNLIHIRTEKTANASTITSGRTFTDFHAAQTSRSIVSPSHNNITTDPTLQLPTMTPGPIFEISPSANWDALFDLPPESWDLFGLDNDNPLIYDDPSMPFPSL